MAAAAATVLLRVMLLVKENIRNPDGNWTVETSRTVRWMRRNGRYGLPSTYPSRFNTSPPEAELFHEQRERGNAEASGQVGYAIT